MCKAIGCFKWMALNVWGSFMFFCLPWNDGSLKEKEKITGFAPSYTLFVHFSPNKKREIYRYVNFGVSDYLQYGGCAFHYFCMVLWCFSIPNVDRWPLSGETYAKIDGWDFFPPTSIQKTQVPRKKNPEKEFKNNKRSGYHLNLVSFLSRMACPRKMILQLVLDHW